MAEPKSLTEMFGGSYPTDHPQSLRELMAADPDTISSELAWELRKQVIAAARASDRHSINSPLDAFSLLKNGYALHPWTGKWTTYALSEARELVMEPHPRGGMTPTRVYTPIIPKVDDLPRLPPARRGGGAHVPKYLVVYGGAPQVLSKDHVAQGLASLVRRVPVADVLFFDKGKESGTAPTMWSLRAGVGMRENGSKSGLTVGFPDPIALNEARKEFK